MEKSEKAENLVKVFGKLAPKVVDKTIYGLGKMYMYDNGEIYEIGIDEIRWWQKAKKLTK